VKATTTVISKRSSGRGIAYGWDMCHKTRPADSMELAYGRLPDGTTYICKGPLLERRAPQVSIGKDTTYGMGLDTFWVARHSGAIAKA